MKQFLSISLVFSTFLLFSQKESFTLMTYNLMYYKVANPPCTHTQSTSARDAAFQTVFKAARPDILCVNEMGNSQSNSGATSILRNVINTDGEENYTSAGYSGNWGSLHNMIFFDSTRFGLHSQDFISNDTNNYSLVRVIDFYRMYYKEPGLKLGADTVFFTVVVAHLKAGSDLDDRVEREDAAIAVMDHLANNVSDENVIFAGDFNVYGSIEGAYQTLTSYAVADESFVDPAAAGAWNNNSTFAPLHTQSTHSSGSGCFSGGGMDDRFDFILHSQAVEDGSERMNFRFGSYEAYGNDGSHFNQNINSGNNTAVSQEVADALYNFSDHLPVLAEYEIAVSGIGLAEHQMRNLLYCNNPFGSALKLTKTEENTTVEVLMTDLSGKKVFHQSIPASKNEISIITDDWKSGIYFMKISDGSGNIYTKKLIKK